MTTQTGANTHVIAIDGNFDDAQTDVKRMFNDVDLREKLLAHHTQFSSANSMNVGRFGTASGLLCICLCTVG